MMANHQGSFGALRRGLGRIGGAFRDFGHACYVLATSPIIHLGVVIFGVYWFVALFVDPVILIQLSTYVLIGASIAVVISYLPNLVYSLAQPKIDRVGLFTLGIVLAWTMSACLRFWSAGMRYFDVDSMRDSPVVGMLLLGSAMAGVLHIVAPGAIEGRIPSGNWIMVGVAVGCGALIAGILIGMNIVAF